MGINRINKDLYLNSFLKEMRYDLLIYLLIGIYTLLTIIYFSINNNLSAMVYLNYTRAFAVICLILCPMVAGLVGTIRIIHRLNSRRRLAFRYMFSPKNLSRFFGGLVLLTAVMVFMGTFTSIKGLLPYGQGFLYDQWLADIDHLLHFGVDPWQHIHTLFGPNVIELVELNYGVVWSALWVIAMCWFAISPGAEKYRLRYFVCYILTWIILGNVLAKMFISAGPAYYGLVTGDDLRFADQLIFFAENNKSASSVFHIQAYLWNAYITGTPGLGTGISAFPSVHVGLTTLNALFFQEIFPRWAFVAFAYVGIILLSSVYLGWHYAIDGYVAIVVVYAIYLLMCKVPFTSKGHRDLVK